MDVNGLEQYTYEYSNAGVFESAKDPTFRWRETWGTRAESLDGSLGSHGGQFPCAIAARGRVSLSGRSHPCVAPTGLHRIGWFGSQRLRAGLRSAIPGGTEGDVEG